MNYKIAFVLAGMDLTIATVCAVHGDSHFVAFMVLAGLMLVCGMVLMAESDKK